MKGLERHSSQYTYDTPTKKGITMENTKEFISYNVVISKEFIHHADSCHKTFSEAKQAIADKLVSIANNDKMSADNKAYWSEKYNNAIIVESISKYTIVK